MAFTHLKLHTWWTLLYPLVHYVCTSNSSENSLSKIVNLVFQHAFFRIDWPAAGVRRCHHVGLKALVMFGWYRLPASMVQWVSHQGLRRLLTVSKKYRRNIQKILSPFEYRKSGANSRILWPKICLKLLWIIYSPLSEEIVWQVWKRYIFYECLEHIVVQDRFLAVRFWTPKQVLRLPEVSQNLRCTVVEKVGENLSLVCKTWLLTLHYLRAIRRARSRANE